MPLYRLDPEAQSEGYYVLRPLTGWFLERGAGSRLARRVSSSHELVVVYTMMGWKLKLVLGSLTNVWLRRLIM